MASDKCIKKYKVVLIVSILLLVVGVIKFLPTLVLAGGVFFGGQEIESAEKTRLFTQLASAVTFLVLAVGLIVYAVTRLRKAKLTGESTSRDDF